MHDADHLKQHFVKMGTPQRIDIKAYADSTGVFETRPLRKESVVKATDLLNINHDNYHIYIHNLGLHSMQVNLPDEPIGMSIEIFARSHSPSSLGDPLVRGYCRTTLPGV